MAKIFKQKGYRALALLMAVLVLVSCLSVSLFVTAADEETTEAEGEAYEVVFTDNFLLLDESGNKILDENGNSQWSELFSSHLITAEKMTAGGKNAAYNNHQGLLPDAEKVTGYVILEFNAGEGHVFKNPSLTFEGRAIMGTDRWTDFSVGLDSAVDGEWQLVRHFSNENNYGSPETLDLSAFVNNVQTFYVKIEMTRPQGTHNTISQLSMAATKVKVSEPYEVVFTDNFLLLDESGNKILDENGNSQWSELFSSHLITAEKMTAGGKNAAYNNHQGLLPDAEKVTGYVILEFNAGEGSTFENPSLTFEARAIMGTDRWTDFSVGLDSAVDGDWQLVRHFSNENNYGSPETLDLSSFVNNVQTFYVKIEMTRPQGTHNVISQLSVAATKVTGGAAAASKPTSVTVDGIEGDALSMKKFDEVTFAVKVGPMTASDRTASVVVEDPSIVELTTNEDGSYKLTAKADGTTNLVVTANGDPSVKATVAITVAGTKIMDKDYPFLGLPATGNTDGSTPAVEMDGTYGLKNFAVNDYIVHEGVDFDANFGPDGATAIALKLAWSSAHAGTTANWDIYLGSVADENLLTSVSADPWGDAENDQNVQFAVGKFDRVVTGKNDIIIVARTAGCHLYNAIYYNFATTDDLGGFDQSFGVNVNPDYSWLDGVVAFRGLRYTVNNVLRSYKDANTRPAEIVWKIDAAEGKVLDTLSLSAAVRNIKHTAERYGEFEFAVSSDRQTWYNVYKCTTETDMENAKSNKYDNFNISATADDYVKDAETIYVRYTTIEHCGMDWHDTYRVKAEATDTEPKEEIVPVTDIAVNFESGHEIAWEGNVGSVKVMVEDELIINVTALPVNATDKTSTVTSSDESVLAVQSNEDGTYTLFADAEGAAVLTITSGDVEKKVNVTVGPKVVTIVEEVNPELNNRVEIVDNVAEDQTNPVQWAGQFGLGYTTPGDYVIFHDVDLTAFGPEGPKFVQIGASNWSGEKTDKTWKVYFDEIKEENQFASFTVKPLNGWDYEQSITAACTQVVTGVRDIYLVCEVGGSVWSLTFTNDQSISEVSYDLPFVTEFKKEDAKWLDYIVNMNGLSFDGALYPSTPGENYNKENPITDPEQLKVNGSVTLKFTAPKGSTLKNTTVTYDGRNIISPQNDPYALINGLIEFYVSTDGENFEKFTEMGNHSGGKLSVNLAEYTDGLEEFYLRVDMTRTANMNSWLRLTNLAVTTETGDVELDMTETEPAPEGLTIPFETSFADDAWKAGIYAQTEGLDVQTAVDANGFTVNCLYPTTLKTYEGMILKFIPEEGTSLENVVLKLRGRAIGASLLNVHMSTDLENWVEALYVSDTAISDDNYDALKLYVASFDEPADAIYIRMMLNSTGSSEGFINYSEISYLSLSTNTVDTSVANVPFNTTFSTGRAQLNSWLRRVTDMQGLYIITGSSEVTMSPATNKSGSITMRFNSGEEAFEMLTAMFNGKAVSGSSITVSASVDGEEFSELYYVDEEVNPDNAGNTAYDHTIDLTEIAAGNNSVWVRLDMDGKGGLGSCMLSYLSVSGENEQDEESSEPSDSDESSDADESVDTSDKEESDVESDAESDAEENPDTGVSFAMASVALALAAGAALTVSKKRR